MKRVKLYLVDNLRSIPGVRVQQLRAPGSVTIVQVGGLRNQDTALLIEGLRFRDAALIAGNATAFLSGFVQADSDRVELLRGLGSSLYGTHAVGGVINLQSSNGEDQCMANFRQTSVTSVPPGDCDASEEAYVRPTACSTVVVSRTGRSCAESTTSTPIAIPADRDSCATT